MSEIKRGDYVVCKVLSNGPYGLVRRVAKDNSWADVWWKYTFNGRTDRWSKRTKCEALEVSHER